MGTLYDYINWRGDLDFDRSPLNEVDSLIFSLISYVDFNGIISGNHAETAIPLKSAANAFFARYPDPKKISMGAIIPKDIIKVFRLLKDSRRFANVGIKAYVNLIDTEKEMQFSAMTFLPGDGSAVIAYRGTDDTLVGWKENFNMSFMPVVPAQVAAVEYLEKAAHSFKGSLRLTGHSKGGNLSVYAATRCSSDVKSRLLAAWSHDGPGFGKGFLNDPQYLEVKPLIKTLVPQSSVIGMLLEHDEGYTVVKSRQIGLWQHDGTSWDVMGDSFVHLKRVTAECRRRDRTINEWIQKMDREQRELFVEGMYQIITSKNALTLTELFSFKNTLLQKPKESIDPHVYKTIQKTLAILIELNTKNILADLFPQKN